MSDQESIEAYESLVTSYVVGLIRLSSARAAALNAQIALMRLNSVPPGDVSGTPHADVIETLRTTSYREFDAFGYTNDLSYLTYATTLLDSFLSDTTRFLLLLHPAATGKEQAVSLGAVIAAESKESLIEMAVTKKARELAYLPFLARLEMLRTTFGLKLELDEATQVALEHYSGVRNVIVHDQSVFDLHLEASGRVVAKAKTCPRHPTALRQEDLSSAHRAYDQVVLAVCRAVASQVLKIPPGARLEGLLDALQGTHGALRPDAGPANGAAQSGSAGTRADV